MGRVNKKMPTLEKVGIFELLDYLWTNCQKFSKPLR